MLRLRCDTRMFKKRGRARRAVGRTEHVEVHRSGRLALDEQYDVLEPLLALQRLSHTGTHTLQAPIRHGLPFSGLGEPLVGYSRPMARVKAYRNLRFRDSVVYSLMGSDGKVQGYTPVVVLEDGAFIVRESGRQRVLRDKSKNVHAFAEGHEVTLAPTKGWVRVRYNPYLFSTFVLASNEKPVARADFIRLDAEGAWALRPRDEAGRLVTGGSAAGRSGGTTADETLVWNG